MKSYSISIMYVHTLKQGDLHKWRPLLPWFFADSKLKEISKNLKINIKISSKVILILRIWRVWLKNQARHAHLYFELKMAVACLILELQKNFKNLFSQKKYFSWGLFFKFLLWVHRFLSYLPKRDFFFRFYPTSWGISVKTLSW